MPRQHDLFISLIRIRFCAIFHSVLELDNVFLIKTHFYMEKGVASIVKINLGLLKNAALTYDLLLV